MVCVFFNDTATTEIYTLSLHDALPILSATVTGTRGPFVRSPGSDDVCAAVRCGNAKKHVTTIRHGTQRSRVFILASLITSRSEEHTSELQSRQYLVCRLLLEKKNNNRT